MKKLLFVPILTLLTISTFAQLPRDDNNKITFSDVIEQKSMKAQNIYEYALTWGKKKGFAVVSQSSGSKITWKGNFSVKYESVQKGGFEVGKVHFDCVVFCKDGRYKYKFTNFVHKARHADCGPLESEKSSCTRHQLLGASWIKIKKQTEEKVRSMVADMKGSIRFTTAVDEDTDDDW